MLPLGGSDWSKRTLFVPGGCAGCEDAEQQGEQGVGPHGWWVQCLAEAAVLRVMGVQACASCRQ